MTDHPPNHSLEQQIQIVNDAGFRVNNLFQIAGGWQANVTDGDRCWEYGQGFTPTAALQQAMLKAKIAPVKSHSECLWD